MDLSHLDLTEQAFLAKGIPNSKVWLRYSLTSWFVCFLAIGIAESAKDSFLVFAYPVGILALVFGFVCTMFFVYYAVPTSVLITPEPFRPLTALFVITFWCSVPLIIYFVKHGYTFSFARFFSYVESHGFFVLKMVGVGFAGSIWGRASRVYAHSTQAYVFLPPLALLLAGWLAPEEDRATRAVGLTPALTYYIGTINALILGCAIGRALPRSDDDAKAAP